MYNNKEVDSVYHVLCIANNIKWIYGIKCRKIQPLYLL